MNPGRMRRLLTIGLLGALAHTGSAVHEGSKTAQISFGGSQVWLIAAGCSTSCYDNNRTTITQIVNGVRVGTAA
jgi:hypothetical protein